MLLNFSDYLKRSYSNQSNLSALQGFALNWFDALLDDFVKLANYFPKGAWEILGIELQEDGCYSARKENDSQWERLFYRYFSNANTPSQFIIHMNNYFDHIVSKINEYFKDKPYQVDNQFFPFTQDGKGVEITCRVRKSDGSIFLSTKNAHSHRGADNKLKDEIIDRMKSSIQSGGLKYLDGALQKIVQKSFLDIADRSEPHAEDDFFITEGEGVVKEIIKNSLDFESDIASDSCYISFFVGQRIEFVITASPCENCKNYFRGLRKILNDKKINIPIVIFSKKPWNDGEGDFDIYVVTYKNDYVKLPFRWVMMKDDLKVEKRLSPSLNSLRLKYKTVLILNIFGQALLPRLVSNPAMISSFFDSFVECYDKNIHIINYIFLDWLKFYFLEVLRSLPFNFQDTSMNQLVKSEAYTEIELSFIKDGYFAISQIKEFKMLIKYAYQGDNALLFFVRLFPKWEELLYSQLKIANSPDFQSLARDANVYNSRSIMNQNIEKHLERKGFKSVDQIKSRLSQYIPKGLSLGMAVDGGDCFFDALAQSLNETQKEHFYSLRSLRASCYYYYSSNKSKVNKWISGDGGSNKEDEYYMIQYTARECVTYFDGRSPIWGRPCVEGKILCDMLNLESICVIEIIHSENQLVPTFFVANKDSYVSIKEDRVKVYLESTKIPVIVVDQKELHFVPLLRTASKINKNVKNPFMKIDQLLISIFDCLYWYGDSTPKNILKKQGSSSGGEEYLFPLHPIAIEFRNLVSLVCRALHYARVEPKYRKNILNSILTAPGNSPLGEDNHKQSDESMAITVYKVERAIFQLCYDTKKNEWIICKLEKIFSAFQNSKMPDFLSECVQEQSSPTKKIDLIRKRTFSQSQAFEGYIGLRRAMFFGNNKSGYVISENWQPFMNYLENDFSKKVIKSQYKLEVIILKSNQLLIRFAQGALGKRSIKKLNDERDMIYKRFLEYLTPLTGHPVHNVDNKGGFSIWLSGPKCLMIKWANKFYHLSFINTISITKEAQELLEIRVPSCKS